MAKKTLTDIELTRGQRICNPCVKRLYSLKDAAEYLGRSVWGVRELIWSRQIPVVQQAGCRKMYLDVNDLEEFINKNKTVYS